MGKSLFTSLYMGLMCLVEIPPTYVLLSGAPPSEAGPFTNPKATPTEAMLFAFLTSTLAVLRLFMALHPNSKPLWQAGGLIHALEVPLFFSTFKLLVAPLAEEFHTGPQVVLGVIVFSTLCSRSIGASSLSQKDRRKIEYLWCGCQLLVGTKEEQKD